MTQIAILKPETARPKKLTVDVLVNLPSGLHHISRLTYSGTGLYHVPLTYKSPESPIDIHTSYHPSGEAHERLTRGKLVAYPGEQVLCKAEPHTNDREVDLWQRKGQPWDSLRGVDRIAQHENGVQGFTNIEAMAAGYPIYSDSDTDYAFEIDAQPLPSQLVDIEYFFVEPGNKQALEAKIGEIVDSWQNPRESVTVEKAELFTNFSPWFAIVLLAKRANGSEYFLSGQP